MEYIDNLNNGDTIDFTVFGNKSNVEITCYGDNSIDENGKKKTGSYPLTFMEIETINYYRSEVDLEDYKEDIENSLKESSSKVTYAYLKNNMHLIGVGVNVNRLEYVDVPDFIYCFESRDLSSFNVSVCFRDRKFFIVGPIDILED